MNKSAKKPVKQAKPVKSAKAVTKPRAARVALVPSALVAAPAPVVESAAAVAPEPSVPPGVPATSQGRAGLRLESSCLLRDALDTQFHLLSAQFGEDVLVDGSAVERIDTAGLQLLVAFVKHHATTGRNVSWTGASEALNRTATRLGLASNLCLPGARAP